VKKWNKIKRPLGLMFCQQFTYKQLLLLAKRVHRQTYTYWKYRKTPCITFAWKRCNIVCHKFSLTKPDAHFWVTFDRFLRWESVFELARAKNQTTTTKFNQEKFVQIHDKNSCKMLLKLPTFLPHFSRGLCLLCH
jgi:hypothetical protein